MSQNLIEAPERTERFTWVEVFRGLAIVEVILHHVSGRFLRVLDAEGPIWWIVAIFNRTLHYAVPAFLMLTAFVLTLSLLRQSDYRRYAQNRVLRALLPYLLWSGLYLLYRWWAYDAPPRIEMVDDYIFWGKAYFHLYFLAVALQLYLLLPLLMPLARYQPPFWLILVGIVGLTMGIYWFNRLVYRLPYTGSFILWYTPTVLLGFWLATQIGRLETVLKRGWGIALIGALVGLMLYLPLALAALRGNAVNTFQYQVGNWLYTGGISFVLLAVAYWLSQLDSSRIVNFLRFAGRYSLQIYLLHPLIISELDRWGVLIPSLGVRFAMPIYLVLSLTVPLGLAWLIARSPRLSVAFFGRS
ncbi:MAG: acyltransferase [Fimbriimonadales bacterium]